MMVGCLMDEAASESSQCYGTNIRLNADNDEFAAGMVKPKEAATAISFLETPSSVVSTQILPSIGTTGMLL